MGEKSQVAGWCVLQESLRLLLGVKVVDSGFEDSFCIQINW
jgi:hypothetical protein